MKTKLISIFDRYLLFIATWFIILFFFGESIAQDNWKAPKSAQDTLNPLLKFKDNAKMNKLGEKLFQSQCSTCHGESGQGDGMAGKYLKVPPADLTSKKFNKQTDGEIHWKITKGKSPMPSYTEIISAKKIWLIINYLRTIQKDEK